VLPHLGKGSSLVAWRAGSAYTLLRLPLLSCPGGGSGNGHRTYSASGFRDSACGKPEGYGAPGLRIQLPEPKSRATHWLSAGRHQVTSPWHRPLALYRLLSSLAHFASLTSRIPPHSREAKFMPWDCKVTPVDCACQEGNTICCTPSNDGLDTGFDVSFPHTGRKQGRRSPQVRPRHGLKV